METIELTEKEKKEFNEFILENEGSFLQSSEWGEFQESAGHGVLRFFVKDGEDILLAASVLKYALAKGKSYLYIPYGPVVKKGEHLDRLQSAFEDLVSKLKEVAKKNGSIFLKVEQENSPLNLKNLKFKKSSKDIQARETLILNLKEEEEEILKGMKQKTRYNIRLAGKKGVNIFEVSGKSSAFSMFWSLLNKTSERNAFRLHPKKYYESMCDMFFGDSGLSEGGPNEKSASSMRSRPASSGSALPLTYQKSDSQWGFGQLKEKIFFAEWEGKILATAMVGFFGKRVTFLHGASSDEHKNLMAPYLLHWEIIKKAKEVGIEEYDFWGIVSPKTDKKKRKAWQGFSKFKEGFGGEVVEYEGAYDFPFSKLWYFLYRIARKIKR